MAGKIQLLSDEVIGKIAAGEVVERPSAAIKEMVENSLDAGATAVTVEIRDGGISYLRVTDNGSGIPHSEIRMAFERHATSKITRTDDLFAIRTLGFRGEALASIAAVAKVTCTTRTRGESSGVKVVNEGGRITAIEEAACPEGTTFVVRDLFFNTPVRLKFLKKPATEAGYVSDLMMRLILSRPDVSFRYISQGKTLYHSAGDGKLSSAVFSIYGRELLRSMREVDGHEAGLLLKGFVGVGDSSRANRGHQSFFINGRYMRSGLLSAAVEAACRERVIAGKYPTCVLHLTLPFEAVDVNVHPNKLEVRFQNEQAIAEAVEAIVRDALSDKDALEKPEVLRLNPEQPLHAPVSVAKKDTVITETDRKSAATMTPVPAVQKTQAVPAPVEKPVAAQPAPEKTAATVTPVQPQPAAAPVQRPALKPLQELKPVSPIMRQTTAMPVYQRSVVPPPAVQRMPEKQPILPAQTDAPQTGFLPDAPKPLRIMGTAFGSYIVAEYEDNLLLIDQRGVHERLLFDRMMKALDTHTCGQELLIPIIVPVTRREQQLLEEYQCMLNAIGLSVEPFGETEVSIRSIPMILGQPQAGDLLREIIDQLESERGVISMERRRSGILALACKKAVRGGERLGESDLRELVSRMVDEKVTPTSPRGTPLIVALTHGDLDRRFRRMQ
ncbi:MAG: DNA mismatch repair endonuclease MutL [Clostridiales bacterium]|nr:DNA mismatch repair endonuclease MutL [Clostridiales bacterium]